MSDKLPEDWLPENGMTTHIPIRTRKPSNRGNYIILIIVILCYILTGIITAIIIGSAS